MIAFVFAALLVSCGVCRKAQLYRACLRHSLSQASSAYARRRSELLSREETEKQGYVWRGNATEESSHDRLKIAEGYPNEFNWCDLNGTSYCTMMRNQ